VVDGLVDLGVGDQPFDGAPLDEALIEPLLPADVGVLEIDEVQLGVVPPQTVPLAVLLEKCQLGHPVKLLPAQHRILFETREHRLPAVEDVPGLVVGIGAVAVLDVLARLVEVLELDLHGGEPATVTERHQLLEGGIV
jgi:hypothetical protein